MLFSFRRFKVKNFLHGPTISFVVIFVRKTDAGSNPGLGI